jgi:hypothetical protein
MEDELKNPEETGQMQAEDVDMERLQQEIRNLPVADHLVYMMQSLSALAVGRMGLSGDERAQADLDQARLAIDAFKALLQVVESVRPAQVTAHKGMLSQLQMAYVAVRDDDSGAGGGDPEPEGASEPSQ